ncbi:MAG: DRTGG domain-containing protein, partial [Candidatus Omnitrophica bacterium]|nr:DRTGG domain-containing protein [Candidatus Omnitrophota bacterium]
KEGVKMIGVIVNKILPDKFDRISSMVRKGIERKGLKVLGIIPYNPMMAKPTVEQILEETGYELLFGKDYVENSISRVIVGAMKPEDAIKYIEDDCFLITPGDREDVIVAALGCFKDEQKQKLKISGLVLTGEITPFPSVMNLLSKSSIPVMAAKVDTYTVASTIHDLTVKIRPRDEIKVSTAIKLIKDYVDLNEILKGI